MQLRKIPLSCLAIRTQKALFIILGGVLLTLFVGYLFMMNQLSLRGYILSQLATQHSSLNVDLERLEADIARTHTRDYVTKATAHQFLAGQEHKQLVIVPSPTVTAQKSGLLHN